MNTQRIDVINIALMLFSVAFALLVPFEAFLISYAVLGPLHYVTEIAWLKKKEYFVTKQKDWISFIAICVVIATALLAIELWPYFQNSKLVTLLLTRNNLDKKTFSDELSLWPSCLIFFAFISAYILTFVKDWFWRINAFVFAIFLVLLFKGTPNYTVIFGILLTTIIHVWLFTGIFILSGATKNKNISAYISFAVFILCSLSFIFFTRDSYIPSIKAFEIVSANNLNLNQELAKIFNLSFSKNDLITSHAALKIQGFIAFAYTYHYLNWFSKVEIIKWHKVSKTSLSLCGIIWVIALGAYAYDYRLGLIFLFFLSVLHVFLEFPLNFRSIAIVLEK